MTVTETIRQAWERQDGESDHNYGHFVAYRDLGPSRTIARVASETTGAPSAHSLRQTSSRWGWPERALAWDDHRDEQLRLSLLRESREAGKRQARHARVYQDALLAPAQALADRLADPMVLLELANLPVRELFELTAEAARAWPAVAKMERLALGQATEEVRIGVGESRSIPVDEDRMVAVFAALAEAGLIPREPEVVVEAEVLEIRAESETA